MLDGCMFFYLTYSQPAARASCTFTLETSHDQPPQKPPCSHAVSLSLHNAQALCMSAVQASCPQATRKTAAYASGVSPADVSRNLAWGSLRIV